MAHYETHYFEACTQIEKLKKDLSDSSAEIVACHTEIEELRAENVALRANTSASVLRRIAVQLGVKEESKDER